MKNHEKINEKTLAKALNALTIMQRKHFWQSLSISIPTYHGKRHTFARIESHRETFLLEETQDLARAGNDVTSDEDFDRSTFSTSVGNSDNHIEVATNNYSLLQVD